MGDTITPNMTPGPMVSQPAMMLSGGMQGSLPPDVTNAPPANVQPEAREGVSMTPSLSSEDEQQPQAPEGVSGNPEMMAAAVHHGRIGRAIDAVSKALGGSQAMHIVEMPDGSYVAKQMDTTPGERWSRIARAALSGAAAGFAGGRGYGGGGGAFTAGAQTGLSMPQQMQDQTMQKAQDLEAQREKGIQFKKNMALLDLQATKLHLENIQSPIKFDAEMQQYADTQRQNVDRMHGVYLAHYTDAKSLADHVQTNNELLKTHVGENGGTLMQVPVYSNGKITGYDVYGIPQNVLNQYNEKEEKVMVQTPSPDGKSLTTSYRTYAPHTELMSNIIADRKAQDNWNSTANLNLLKLKNEVRQTDIEQQKADEEAKLTQPKIGLMNAQAAEAWATAQNKKNGGSWKPYSGGTGPNGEPLFRNDQGDIQTAQQIAEAKGQTYTGPKKVLTANDRNTYQNKYVLPMNTADAFLNVLQKGYDNARAGKGSGAAELSALQETALSALNLTGTGSKASGAQMIDRELEARGIVDKKTGFFTRLANGQSLSADDWKKLVTNAQTHRDAAVTKTAEGAKGYGMPATPLIRDQGRDTSANRAVAQGYGIPAQYRQVITDADGKILGFGAKDKNGTPTLYYDIYGEKM